MESPRAPLGHLARLGFALVGARDVDEIARCVLTDLVALPGVRRVGIALSEGGGRRLTFTASDGVATAEAGAALEWCHIDAYDDVPLTTVARTGEPVMGSLESLDPRYAALVDRQPPEMRALAAVPLPGTGSPIGGLVMFFDEPQDFAPAQRTLLEATARRTAEAVRRVRASSPPLSEPSPEVPDETRPLLAASTRLPDDTQAPGTARRFLRGVLTGWGVPEDSIDTAELCLSELVTNAVVHAGTTSEVVVSLEEQVLTVRVHDRGAAGLLDAAQPDHDPDLLRVHGRGLLLVEALTHRWGSERDARGAVVWFVLEVDRPAGSASRTG